MTAFAPPMKHKNSLIVLIQICLKNSD